MSGHCARGLRNASCAILAAFFLVQRPDGGDAAFNDLTGSMVDDPLRQTAPPQAAAPLPPPTFPQESYGQDVQRTPKEAEGGAATASPPATVSQGLPSRPGPLGYFSPPVQPFAGAPNPAITLPPLQPHPSSVAAAAGPGFASGFPSFSVGIPSRLTVHTPEAGDVTTAPPVSDTSVPVGFYSSANGVYKVPRFPSSVNSVSEPSEEAIRSCILRVPASKMTNGFSDTLKSGGVNIMGNASAQLLRIIATSSPRYTSKLSAPVVLFQRAMGTRISYEMKVAVPRGCVLLPSDPSLVGFIRRDGNYVVEAAVRLLPDILAEYTSSVAAVPADLVAFAAALPPDSNFQPAGHCVFVAHFTTTPENIRLAASYTQVRVEGDTAMGTETLQLEIPLMCLPQSLHRTAMWATKLHNGTAVIVAFSPPPKPEPEWFVVRTSGDEAALQRLVGVRP
ncbi:uncharacterized protein EMH_0001190 [Eimeria mitis]|uniref:Transmembrane protein n=1 Tax=Eimeria mitis TaxID=44415 RepID=U6JSI1_9EIME|nr:uncharacterized protein EMH_0001190 [Eimeria mitis]CDJ28405.1 hypothetical protein, conserved [Eimeria mitis]